MLELQHDTVVKEAIEPAENSKPHIYYMFSDLQPATTYSLKVAACSEFTHKCHEWSKVVNGTTMDQREWPLD